LAARFVNVASPLSEIAEIIAGEPKPVKITGADKRHGYRPLSQLHSKLQKVLRANDVDDGRFMSLNASSLRFSAAMRRQIVSEWLQTKGKSEQDALEVADKDLDELSSWLAQKGRSVDLTEMASELDDAYVDGLFAQEDVERRLISALIEGQLTASGRYSGGGEPRLIPSHFWRHLKFDDVDFTEWPTSEYCARSLDLGSSEIWASLRFSKAEVEGIWPPHSDQDSTATAGRPPKSMGSARRFVEGFVEQKHKLGSLPTITEIEKTGTAVGHSRDRIRKIARQKLTQMRGLPPRRGRPRKEAH
jgi:hypothetical protein